MSDPSIEEEIPEENLDGEAFQVSHAVIAAITDAGEIRQKLLTHHAKVLDSQAGIGSPVINVTSIGYDGEFRHGICSPSIKSDNPLGLESSAQTSGIANSLCTAWGDDARSALSMALHGDREALEGIGIVGDKADILIEATSDLESSAPDAVDVSLKQVYFEAGADEVLVTPLAPVKIIHEMNLRFHHMLMERKAWKDRRAADPANETSDSPSLPHNLMISAGGANPQNVGYIVNKNSLITRNKGFRAFVATPPAFNRTPAATMIRRLLGGAAYEAVTNLDPADLTDYGRRAAIAIELASHKNAEAMHADQIVCDFFAPLAEVRSIMASKPRTIWTEKGWNRLSSDTRALVDPREGEFDRHRLAERFAEFISNRVAKTMNRTRGGNTEGNENARLFVMPPRSRSALVEAFLKALSEIQAKTPTEIIR